MSPPSVSESDIDIGLDTGRKLMAEKDALDVD
jgi:hypothetical protein